ncbi:hypothetical protein [Accumulibacter sp.]|uniref:hypothetical protein n=1 Tax=Accumulibacter sp. TaxID=2053492 RepID=UPI0025FB0C8C|nr:hypothetical protein [Accumulibacter sp.]MCM8612039.1 hypothetical protein [Accumulibacter sp.]MCM8636021.1 hypothetical protein [Accumulibacter sp.]MCM8639862.1 hypothetical protein [Accumulibacter sp.]
MELGSAWSLVRLVSSGMNAVGVNTGPLGAAVGGPVGVAVTSAFLVKKWVDSSAAKMLELVRQREACAHIEMLEGAPPTPSAVEYVSRNAGMAWRFGESALYFWHPEASFKPLVFNWALVPGKSGVDLVRDSREYDAAVSRPIAGYGCSRCRAVNAQR